MLFLGAATRLADSAGAARARRDPVRYPLSVAGFKKTNFLQV